MKKVILLTTIITVYLASCSKDNGQTNMQAIKVQIPEVLKENREAGIFIKESTRDINEWTEKLNQLCDDCRVYSNKEASEMSLDEKQKLGKAMMDYMSGMGQFAVRMAEIENNGESLAAQLSGNESAALLKILALYHYRIQELNLKYEQLSQAEE